MSQQWKEAERRVAALFASNRRPLSGSNSGEGAGDDARNDAVYLESKYAKYIPIMRLYRECRDKCKEEKRDRIPVIALQEKHQPGMLLCVHSTNLERLLREWASVNGFRIEEDNDLKKSWKRVHTKRDDAEYQEHRTKDPRYKRHKIKAEPPVVLPPKKPPIPKKRMK
jgi:hypothetical protein